MPIYEYRRPDGSTFEVLQSFADAPLTHDPQTGVEVTRVLHAPAVHFKGSGFYNTDYGTRRRQRENAAESNGSVSSGEQAGASEHGGSGGSGGSSGSGDSGASPGAAADGVSKPAAKRDPVAKGKREPAPVS